jgi:acetate kinase
LDLARVSPDRAILVVNAGSTSLKLHLVDAGGRSEPVEAIEAVEPTRVDAVAHRVVHGGPTFRDPVVIDVAVRERIFELEPLAPLHNAPALRAIERAEVAFPDLPHVAVFDTGFHKTIPPEAAVYPLPPQWREEWGIHRYGFHGLSVAWSARRAPELLELPADGLRLVVCHLGGGSSVSAVRDGRSLDTTMGFSPLEGVPMATRSGSIDPGALIYLMREHGLGIDDLEHGLNYDSGLRGLAGGSGDMLELVKAAERGDTAAELAIEVFAHRLTAAVAAMALAAGGLDALVFTAGIGENSAPVRDRVCRRLGLLGVKLDRVRNEAARPDCELTGSGSQVRVLVVRAREELIAAEAARRLV